MHGMREGCREDFPVPTLFHSGRPPPPHIGTTPDLIPLTVDCCILRLSRALAWHSFVQAGAKRPLEVHPDVARKRCLENERHRLPGHGIQAVFCSFALPGISLCRSWLSFRARTPNAFAENGEAARLKWKAD